MSSYEEKVIEILKKEKIHFKREVRFSDLKKGKYRFDFEVYVDCAPVLLEIQGEQHYKFVSKFYKSRRDFEAAKERDRRKISYALANDIPLYIIPFWEIENLKSADDLFKDKFRAKDRWKNDKDKSFYLRNKSDKQANR